MKLNHTIFIVFTAFVLQACEKVIDLNLKNIEPQLIIEGNVDNEGQPAFVKISRSVNFNSPSNYPGVSGAVVSISEVGGNTYSLNETITGYYSNRNLRGVIGKTYNLSVLLNGKTYTASSTIPRQAKIDTIIQNKFLTARDGNVPSLEVYYRDLPGFGDYAHIVQEVNRKSVPLLFNVDDDRFSDGGIVPFQIVNIDNNKLKVGDTVRLQLRFVDQFVYRYLRGLQDNALGNTVPANPENNIKGEALGIFSAHAAETKTLVIR